MLLHNLHFHQIKYSPELGDKFDANGIAHRVKDLGATVTELQNDAIAFRMNIRRAPMMWSYVDVYVRLRAEAGDICDVTVSFRSLKRVTAALFSMAILGGVVLKIPGHPADAAINLVLLMAVWKITIFIYLVSRSRVVRKSVDIALQHGNG